MIQDDQLERQLTRGLRAVAGTAVPDYLSEILARTSRTTQLRSWGFPGTSFRGSRAPADRALAALLAAMLVLAVGVGGAIVVSSREPASSLPSPAPAVAGPILASPVTGLQVVHQISYDKLVVDVTGKLLQVFYAAADSRCQGLDRVDVDGTGVPISVTVWVGTVPGDHVCRAMQIRYYTVVQLNEPIVVGGAWETSTLVDLQAIVETPCTAEGGCAYGARISDQDGNMHDSWFVGDPSGWMEAGPGVLKQSTYTLSLEAVRITEPMPSRYEDARAGKVGGCEATFDVKHSQEAVVIRAVFNDGTCRMEISDSPG